jgi:hypothetical protein
MRGRHDGRRPVHRGLVIVLFLLMGIAFAGKGVEIGVQGRAVARDGRTAEATVLTYRHTVYAGAIGRVYVGAPLYREAPALALRTRKTGAPVRVRYLSGERLLVAEEGAPLNTDAILLWTLLGTALMSFAAWSARSLYAEQRQWERLEADLLDR